jgi:phenylpropionate dioxygenase-like ring-hydroxylating dioxygenase large terminal subunit
MLSREDNELLTRVCGDAPMGQMLRAHCWIPAAITPQLAAGEAPVRVRLLGEDFVAFRATDGRVGFFDEACPHRGVSLALAHNEDNALRCIFHGWKYSVDGRCVEVPTQPVNHEGFCRQVRVNHYPTREAGGVIWVYLGKGEPPPFHEFEFLRLPTPTHVYAALQKGDYNWLQAVETTMDSAHLGILHKSSINAIGDISITKQYTAPTFETEHKPYGFRYASIRTKNEGDAYVRVNTFVAPWFSFIAPTNNGQPGGTVQFTAPMDDEHSMFFFLEYRPDGISLKDSPIMQGCTDLANWPPNPSGGPEERWGQDREAMKRGHFTGFTANLLTEDLAVVTSMKPIVDRSKEQLNAADTAIVNVRRAVLQQIREFMRGEVPSFARRADVAEDTIFPESDNIPDAARWREYFTRTRAAV